MSNTQLQTLADQAMLERGLDPQYSRQALREIKRTQQAAEDPRARDLRDLPWCSVDNGEGEVVTSKDLDQVSAAVPSSGDSTRVYVAIADVDALVPRGGAVDRQAQRNTTTVYTADKVFPMIHPHFSENLTSLRQGQDRLTVVTEMVVGPQGEVTDFSIYRAQIRNHVELNYSSTGLWLEGQLPPQTLADHADVQLSLRLQHGVAQRIKQMRRRLGSLELESLEARAEMEGGRVVDMKGQLSNAATELIENLMIACNGCSCRFLSSQGFPTLQRIVRRPKFWPHIVEVAEERDCRLPDEPDSRALERFLEHERHADPLRFPDLSLRILKLLGRGEYVVELPGEPPIGHFGLAVREYAHSTAPNRRYPDVITQRLLKAALAGERCPYQRDELESLARRCSEQEAAAQKVERQLQKSAAASMLESRVGEIFPALVSGQNPTGVWVRLLTMPIEGKLIPNGAPPRLGQRLQVKLVAVNVARGFLDFRPAR